jgi:hypothetical protein
MFHLKAETAGAGADKRTADPLLLERWMACQEKEAPVSSNQPAIAQAFQRWFKFKEAFSPQFILDCVASMEGTVNDCLDPFGGSGTCALTCQFLGIQPTTIEVNPFLADLITAKLGTYDLENLEHDFLTVLESTRHLKTSPKQFLGDAPQTMVEPGDNGRWIFSRDVAQRILNLRQAIEELKLTENRRLLKVVLGSNLIELSNVIVNGKGRRYRNSWAKRKVTPEEVGETFKTAFNQVLTDLQQFGKRPCNESRVLRGDCRKRLTDVDSTDLVIFSPPYPNSFDYTDIYNIELWMLGYLQTKEDNSKLRKRTFRSHVQIKHPLGTLEGHSDKLDRTYRRLVRVRDELWNKNIPEMVTSYFRDMLAILKKLRQKLLPKGRVFMAVGDSKYARVIVDVPGILEELASHAKFTLVDSSAIRSMRASAQQGGRRQLKETVLCLRPI